MELDKVVKKHPRGEGFLLREISGTVDEKGITFLIGPSGCGKSTLLRLLNRLENPDGGSIVFQGRELGEWDVLALRRKVAMVFQNPAPFPGTVLDNMAFVAGLQKGRGSDGREWLDRVQLPQKTWNQPAKDLSGGERQRLALARALMGEPEFLLLDEAASALDPAGARGIEDLLLTLHEERGLGILWVSHEPEQVQRMAREVWALRDGEVIARGNPAEVLANPSVRAFFGEGGPR